MLKSKLNICILISITFISHKLFSFSGTLPVKEPGVVEVPAYTHLTEKLDPACELAVHSMKKSIKAGLAFDITTGEIFWEYNSTKKCEIASLTKIMVELLAMEKLEAKAVTLDDMVAVTQEASCITGTRVRLKKGEIFPLESLLRAALIFSANDASHLAGYYIGGGSKEKFIKMMNKRSLELGMTHTRYWNMTGLPPKKCKSEANISDCMDLATVSLQLLKYPCIREWMCTKSFSFREGAKAKRATNTLMRNCEIVDGLKTGFYPNAGWNIVATSLCGDRKIMVIILGAKSRKTRDDIARKIIRYEKPSELMAGK
jgi:D-alanyl-D-alanine carboxypeptidase